jgi:hypothetical protein
LALPLSLAHWKLGLAPAPDGEQGQFSLFVVQLFPDRQSKNRLLAKIKKTIFVFLFINKQFPAFSLFLSKRPISLKYSVKALFLPPPRDFAEWEWASTLLICGSGLAFSRCLNRAINTSGGSCHCSAGKGIEEDGTIRRLLLSISVVELLHRKYGYFKIE